MPKDMIWHELYERLSGCECPICELIDFRVGRRIEHFLYESVNDTDQRKKIRDAGGLCNYHAHMIVRMGDPLAHAIIYSDLLDAAIGKLLEPHNSKRPRFQSHEGCLFCVQIRECEQRYVPGFIDGYREADFAEKYRKDGLLCLPHLEMIKQTTKKPDLSGVVETTIEKYKALIGNLSEIKKKHDYRFLDEPWTEQEKTAWGKAVDIVNGKEGIRK